MSANISRKQLLNIHSEEMQEIVGQAPRKLIRYGMTIFSLAVMIMLLVGWIIRYPDIINASFTLAAANSPKAVVAHIEGKLEKVLVLQGQQVVKDQVLAYIESTANHENIIHLATNLVGIRELAKHEQWNDIRISTDDYTKLGEVQSSFQSFYSNYTHLHAFFSEGLYHKKKQALHADLKYNDSLQTGLLRQKDIYENDYQIAENDYTVKKELYKEKILAPLEIKQEESKLLSKKLPIENITASLTNNRSNRLAKENELMELEKEFIELKYDFVQSLNTLESEIEAWKKKYLLIAPDAGRLTFPTIIQEGQEIALNQEVLFVAPINTSFYGELLVEQENFGKITLNQPVVIRLASFPFQEYGKLQGIVSFISDRPNEDNQFIVKVDLPHGLITSNGTEINFSNGLSADAEIITAKTRLISKLLYTLIGLSKGTKSKKPPNKKSEKNSNDKNKF